MNKEHSAKEQEHKKEPKKKGRPKKEASAKKSSLKTIKPEQYFFLCDGRVLKDMHELADCLETINNDVFCHHVNDARNDFSNWIKDIFENMELSEEIFTIRDPRNMHIVILKHLAKKR